MRPQHLTANAYRHLTNALTRLVTYDLPYTVGHTVCKLFRKVNAIEDFFIADRFCLRPFFACDRWEGALHISMFHTHLIIETRRHRHGHDRSLQTQQANGPAHNPE